MANNINQRPSGEGSGLNRLPISDRPFEGMPTSVEQPLPYGGQTEPKCQNFRPKFGKFYFLELPASDPNLGGAKGL
jgi:hypothetical protein